MIYGMAQYMDPVFHVFLHLFVNICDHPSTDPIVWACFLYLYQVIHVIDTWSFPGMTEPSVEFLFCASAQRGETLPSVEFLFSL